MTVRPFEIVCRRYDPSSELFELLAIHHILVARKARELARGYLERHPDAGVDLEFLTEAALLHDIGIGSCNAPAIYCTGPEPYIRHGVIGRGILEAEGLPRHALVCERHTGAGITRREVVEGSLPLPDRDYMPVSIEEKIICVADKFYSKSPAKLWREKTLDEIAASLGKWGADVLDRWEALRREVIG